MPRYVKQKDKYIFYDDNNKIIIITRDRIIGEQQCRAEKELTEQK
jgi:hypothetical protein